MMPRMSGMFVKSLLVAFALGLGVRVAQAQGAPVKPDKPDAAKPDKPDAAKPDAAKPDAAKPDAAKPGGKPDGGKAVPPDTDEPGDIKPVPPELPKPVDDDDDDDFGDDDDALPPALIEADYSKVLRGYDHEPHHNHRWFYHNITAVRLNPLGLTNRFRTGYQMQLSHRPEPIFMKSHGSVALDTEITPAFGYVGARLEVQPVVLFNFWASYGVVGNFGSFSYTRSFQGANEHSDDDFLKSTRSLDYGSVGQKATISGLFQFGIGGLAMRNNTKAHWAKLDLQDGHQVYSDASLDVLAPNGGWVITNDTDVIIITDIDLKIGLRYTLTHALYRKEHLAGQPNINTPHHRIGPAFIYTFFEEPDGSQWNKPTLVLLAQWWMKHRYRTSQKPGLPYLVIAFVQEGDLFISPKE